MINPLEIKFDSCQLTNEQFYKLCQDNRDLRFERNSNGDILIMPPTGGETSNRNIEISYQVQAWSRQSKLGIAFDSSAGFTLPNKADRSPDASWIPLEKWNNLTPQQRQKFLPLCPDFVIELRSPSDSLKTLQEKMQEYMENGTKLGWLINRKDKQVEILNNTTTLSGENVLPNFVLELELIW